jgi:hypothetical protein
VEFTVEDEEEFVGVVMDVPEVLTVGMGDPDVVIIDLADDPRAVDLIERRQRLGEIDGLGSHDSIVCPLLVVFLNGVRRSV